MSETTEAETSRTSRGRAVQVVQETPANVAHATLETTGQVSQAVSETDSAASQGTTPPLLRTSEPSKDGDSTSPLTRRPARGYSWDPFIAGNTAAVSHGASSARSVDPIAREIARELRAMPEFDYLSTPRFTEPLWAYAQAQAKVQLVRSWVEDMPIEQQAFAQRGTTPPLELLRQLEGRAGTLADRLGFFPTMSPDVAADIVAARVTLARRAERKALHDDLRASLTQQVYGTGDRT